MNLTPTKMEPNIHIYIYILLIKYLPVITVSEKNQKPLPRDKRKNVSSHGPEEKEKSFLGKKERKDQPRSTP